MLRPWIGVLGALCVGLSAVPAQAQSTGRILGQSVDRVLDKALGDRLKRPQNPTIDPSPVCALGDRACIDAARRRGETPRIVTEGFRRPVGGQNSGGSSESLTINGVTFPQGAISFADKVVNYNPGSVAPSTPHRGADNALGQPDYDNRSSCVSQADCSFVSLGSGGTLTVEFTDNVLTGSGTSDIDLWIFEVGPQVEAMFVEISSDGRTWHSVGAIGGGKSGVDIDAFGHGPSTTFRFVRLRDDPARDGRSGATVGADVDAIGAISTRSTENCDCADNAAQASASFQTFAGVVFPQGAISFADEVVSRGRGNPYPTAPHERPANALGVPDYNNRSSCSSAADCTFYSLGRGGSLVLRFTDNVLTGSGNDDIDLWIFEVGPQVEHMSVDISADGRTWHSVGTIGGGKSGVDIDAFGFGPSSSFSYVRLTDDPNEGGNSGPTVGADIDAVGAISTRSAACDCAAPR
ncbi:MAG: hypothetical protein AB7E60_07000 [Sphingobium sp.]